jgi:hypothetical protein
MMMMMFGACVQMLVLANQHNILPYAVTLVAAATSQSPLQRADATHDDNDDNDADEDDGDEAEEGKTDTTAAGDLDERGAAKRARKQQVSESAHVMWHFVNVL